MKTALTFAIALAALAAFVGVDTAEAARIGGGRSFGAQRQITPPPAMPKAAPAAPAAPSQALPGKAAPAAAASGASRWLGPLAGLAAGLGLAALFSHFGLSDSFGSLLLIMLLVGGGIVVVRMLMARRTAPANPLRYAGANNESPRVEPHLGASSGGFEPVMGGAAQPATPGRYPPGFDPVPFVEQAKRQFRMLQSAYDTRDREALAEVLTPAMLTEVTNDIAKRGTHVATDVMRLDAEILEVKTEGDRHWMSVRFTGLLREDGTVLPKEFEETWNLTKPLDDSTGWLLAGIQQTHEMA